MIEAVELSYLQSWKYGLFEFVQGVNIITGTSDKGKTGIIRGLRLAAVNEPRRNVNALVSTLKKKKNIPTSVTIQFSDGTVALERVGSQNKYILNGDDEHPYKALSGNVPDTVAKAVNMSSLNFQLQHEPYFLLNESAGKVAKKFNELANLQIMDSALVVASGRCRSITTRLNVSKEAISGLENKVNDLKWLDSAKKPIKRALAIQNKIDGNDSSIDYLKRIIKRLSSIDLEIESFEILLGAEEQLEEAFAVHVKHKAMVEKVDSLRILKMKLKLVDKKLNKLKSWDGAAELIEEGQSIFERWLTNDDKRISLAVQIKKLKTNEYLEEGVKENIVDKETRFNKLLKQEGVCPLCGGDV